MVVVTYLQIALIMMVVFSVLMVGVPIAYTTIAYLSYIGKGHDYGSWRWKDDYLLKNLDEFFDSINAYDCEDRTIAIIVFILAFSVLWGFGVPIFIYWVHCMVKKIRNEQYNDVVNNGVE